MGNPLQLKDTILKKSRKAFREHGYTNTSISLLASICQLSKSHFYYYFDSKETLMEEVLNMELKYFTEEVFSLAYEEAFSPRKRLKKMFKQLDNSFCKNNDGSLMAITIFHSSGESSKRFFPIARTFYSEWEKALFFIFSTRFNSKKSRKLTLAAMLQVEGALLFLLMNNDPQYLHETMEHLLVEFKK
jgi:AcrR family transcriptional regulator